MINGYEVQKKITEYADLKTKLTLRKVCRQMRSLVDKDELVFSELFVVLSEDTIRWGYKMSQGDRGMLSYDKENHKDRSFIGRAAVDLCTILANSRAEILELNIDVFSLQWQPMLEGLNITSRIFFSKIGEHLAKFNHQIHVESLRLAFDGHADSVMSILPFVKPGSLKKIHFEFPDGSASVDLDLNRIGECEAWKQAKQFRSTGLLLDGNIDNFQYFNECYTKVNRLSNDEKDRLCEAYLRNPEFQFCYLNLPQTTFPSLYFRNDKYTDLQLYLIAYGRDGYLHIRSSTERRIMMLPPMP